MTDGQYADFLRRHRGEHDVNRQADWLEVAELQDRCRMQEDVIALLKENATASERVIDLLAQTITIYREERQGK